MPRGLDASTTTALGAAITRPYYLVYLGFETPVQLSSTVEITWGSPGTWLAASFDVLVSESPTIDIFNEGTSIGSTVLSDGTTGRTVKIYYGDRADSAHPNPVLIFDGEMAEATIGERVLIRCKRFAPIKTPRHYIAPPICNHIPPPGTRFETRKQVIILERE